jgi:hypothetical protein
MTFLLYLDILSIKQVRTFFFTNTCIVGHISKLSPLPNFVKGDNSLKFLIPTVYPMLVGHISKLSPLPNFVGINSRNEKLQRVISLIKVR